MGSYISIGFIYDELSQEKIKKELSNILNYLLSYNAKTIRAKVSKDIYGEEWIEKKIISTNEEHVFEMLSKYYFGQLEVSCNLLGYCDLGITIRVEKEEDFFGFLLDISEKELIKTNTLDEINNVTDRIVDFIIDMHNKSSYDYAFCDNEAEIKYSPREYRTIKDAIYSISIMPIINNEITEFSVIKSKWNIDGLTSRY